jgi:hypothetical protein
MPLTPHDTARLSLTTQSIRDIAPSMMQSIDATAKSLRILRARLLAALYLTLPQHNQLQKLAKATQSKPDPK